MRAISQSKAYAMSINLLCASDLAEDVKYTYLSFIGNADASVTDMYLEVLLPFFLSYGHCYLD